MKITAITRYKHGEMFEMLKRLGWSQSELARRSGYTPTIIGRIINLQERPTAEQADAIQKAFGEGGEYLDVLAQWPETFTGLKPGYKLEQSADVELERLLDTPEAMNVPALEYDDTSELDKTIESVIGELTPRETAVMRLRFWQNKTLAEIGDKFRVTRLRVHQVQQKALRTLRHPSRIKKLAPHLTYVSES